MQIIRFANCIATPWKNGGGITTELASDPPGATLDNFNWRLSLARIDRSGPFSRFPGIDRTLAVIGGSDVTLHIDDRAPLPMLAGSGVAQFPGELNVHAEVTGSGSEDFNVMSRRGRWHHAFTRIQLSASTTIERCADVLALFHVMGSPLTVDVGEHGFVELRQRDALVLDSGDVDACGVTPADGATLFAVRLSRV